MKRILSFFFEPIKFFANRKFAEKLSVYLSKKPVVIAFISFLITLLIIFFTYIFPNLQW